MANFTATLNPEPYVFIEEFNVLKTFIYYLWFFILTFGLVSNTINIMVFAKIGFRDNVTVTLLFLSLSDLLNLILNCPMVVARFIGENYLNFDRPFDRQILYFGLFWYAYVFYDYSSFISVFLALVRCFCVARPLRFKSMFTTTRTVIILIILFLLAVTFRVPILTISRLIWTVNPRTNSTWRSLQYTENFREIYKANDIFNRNIVSWVAYITATTCVIILVSKLRAASKFRQSVQRHTRSTQNDSSNLQIDETKEGNHSESKNGKPPETLSSKDVQVVQSVTLICVIFILSQFPFQTISIIRLLNPAFGNEIETKFVVRFANHISNTLGYLNASVNIFLYYNFNARYRLAFLHFFSTRYEKGDTLALRQDVGPSKRNT